MKRFMQMNARDHVATALEDAARGDQIGVYDPDNHLLFSMEAEERIPFGNKIALVDLAAGCELVKYGAVIGICTTDILRGHLVHVHNVKSRTVDIPPAFKREIIRQMHIGEESE